MKSLTFKLLILVTTTSAIAGLILAQSAGDNATLKQISGYRQWTRVTPEPVAVPVDLISIAG